jgi:hypothetical protein
MLVLSDADRFRVDLHEFGERILQAARDGGRTAQRNIEMRKLLARDFGRRVDRRARFVDHEHRRTRRVERRHEITDERLRFARRGAIPDRD